MINLEILKALTITAEVMNKDLSKEAAKMFAEELSLFPTPMVLSALTRCRRELKSFPALSEVLARIDDGRPGPEEAWAMIPKDEIGSVIWTEEMAGAFGTARLLLNEGDEVAARMAFKESYIRLSAEARNSRTPVRWTPSFGFDVAARNSALAEAVNKKRITFTEAKALLPDIQPMPHVYGKLLTFMKDMP